MIDYDMKMIREIRKDFSDSIEGEIQFYQRLSEMEVIPFDVIESVTTDPICFGYLGSGSRLGTFVRLDGQNPLLVDADPIGIVVGDYHGRLVIDFNGLFFGWIDSNKVLPILNFYESLTIH